MTRVLVVDDRPDVRLSFMYLLAACGFHAAEAQDGIRALEYLDREPATDIILTDLDMPGMDGVQLLRAVHARHSRPPRVIVMTGSVLETDVAVAEARRAGAAAVLVKPISQVALQQAIREVLGSRR